MIVPLMEPLVFSDGHCPLGLANIVAYPQRPRFHQASVALGDSGVASMEAIVAMSKKLWLWTSMLVLLLTAH